jgi:hypothetical protein
MGITRVTYRGLLRRLNPNEKFNHIRLMKGLLRLRTAGLVIDQGRQKIEYPGGESWLLLRKIMGWTSQARHKPNEDVVIMVPPDTMTWVSWVEGHRGGKRPGAGMKKRIKSDPNTHLEKGQEEVKKGQEAGVEMSPENGIKKVPSTPQNGIKKVPSTPENRNQKGLYVLRSDLIYNIPYASSPNGEEERGARPEIPIKEEQAGDLPAADPLVSSGLRPELGASRSVSFSFGEATHSPEVTPTVPPLIHQVDPLTPQGDRAAPSPTDGVRAVPFALPGPPIAAPVSPASQSAGCAPGSGCQVTPADHDMGIDLKVLEQGGATYSPTLGISMGGTWGAGKETTSPWFIPGLPRYPDFNVMPPVYLPSPPRLPGGLTDLEAAEWLVKSFRGAAKVRTKKTCWMLAKRGSVEKSKHLPMLVQAARKLEADEISPAAWTAFSFDVWLANDNGKQRRGTPRLPPLAWVFSVKRMDERVDWFYDELAGYRARRVLFTRPAQDLLRRFAAFQVALRRRDIDGETVEVIVGRFFPGDLYDRMLAAAKVANRKDQELANDMLARGEWLGW